MKLTDSEKEILRLASIYLLEHYDKLEQTVRDFKWICEIPQAGKKYEENINIFVVQDITIARIKEDKQKAIDLINKIYKET